MVDGEPEQRAPTAPQLINVTIPAGQSLSGVADCSATTADRVFTFVMGGA